MQNPNKILFLPMLEYPMENGVEFGEEGIGNVSILLVKMEETIHQVKMRFFIRIFKFPQCKIWKTLSRSWNG